MIYFLQENNLLKKDEKLQVLYVKDDEPFPEVSDFMEKSKDVYNLDIVAVSRPMKEGLQGMLEARPHIQAAILGTRNGDPNASSQKKFCPTDSDWPKLMRVNPILKWNYADIWTLIRGLNLPYPGLYDRGYTSLGDRRNTVPNPSLIETDNNGKVSYKPAYLLEDGTLERNGRK
jgi:FAD synthetase